MTAVTRLEPKVGNRCFGCGADNPRGMLLTFESDDARQRIIGRFRMSADYQGGPGFLHGGIIATLIDEAMGKVNRFSGARAVTAQLDVEYHRPVPVEADIVVEAWQAERVGRFLIHAAEIRDAAGKLLASGRGRFVAVDPEKYAAKLKSVVP